MTPPNLNDESQPLRELRRIAGGACQDCQTRYTVREAIWSIALGFKNAPRCLPCLATRLHREPDELVKQLTRYIHGRECYLVAWRAAEQMEGSTTLPQSISIADQSFDAENPDPASVLSDADWDAGTMGCGELVMQLRIRLNKLPAGSVFQVKALDPAAPEDLPAWCRMTGHTLLAAQHPYYRIRRRDDADGR